MYEQNTSMVAANEQNKFLLPAMVEGDFSRDEIAEDADGLQMMSFQRVKIPAGAPCSLKFPRKIPTIRIIPGRWRASSSTTTLPILCGRKAASMTKTPNRSAPLWMANRDRRTGRCVCYLPHECVWIGQGWRPRQGVQEYEASLSAAQW